MGIGELRHRITIQKFTTVVGDNGYKYIEIKAVGEEIIGED